MAATYQPPQWLVPENTNTDKVGNYSFDFDGSADYIDIGNPAALQITGALTISCWVKSSDTTDYVLIQKDDIGSNRSYALWGNEWGVAPAVDVQFLVFNGGSATTVNSTTDINDGNWHHVVAVYNPSTTMQIYIDGSLDGENTTSIPASIDNDPANFQIGRGGNGLYYMDGKISEVCIFNYALSASNITTLYGNDTNGVGNPMGLDIVPIAYYKGDRAGLGDQWAVPNQVSQDYVFDFDGIDDFISIYDGAEGSGPISFTDSDDFSISAWVKTSSTAAQNQIVSFRGTALIWFYTTGTNRRLAMYLRDDSGNTQIMTSYNSAAGYITADTWTNVLFTRNGTTKDMNMYLNGVAAQVTTANTTSDDFTAYDKLTVGNDEYSGGRYWFDGDMSNVVIYDSDQSANALTIYNNGTPGDLTSLSPLSWWKLDDSATFSANWSIPDAGSDSNTGTSSGMTQGNLIPDTVTRGTALYSDYSFDFDGAGDSFGIGTTSLGITSAISVSAWVKTTDTLATYKVIACEDETGGANRNWNLLLNSSRKVGWLVWSTDGTVQYIQRATVDEISDGNWHHILGTYDGTTDADGLKLYVDGDLESATATSTGVRSTAGVEPYIGSLTNGASWLWDGGISNVAIWNSDQSANVTTIYNNGRPADLTSLSPMAWWRLGENASWNGSVWTIKDQMGSNDGTSAGPPNLVGDAPQSFANGLSVSMDIDSRIGESGLSSDNALSYNMAYDSRSTSVPG
tara:strand:+ start:2236 stop:4455 length:2220 start_codon:yes stop_codon:yes gene_type:complete